MGLIYLAALLFLQKAVDYLNPTSRGAAFHAGLPHANIPPMEEELHQHHHWEDPVRSQGCAGGQGHAQDTRPIQQAAGVEVEHLRKGVKVAPVSNTAQLFTAEGEGGSLAAY
ncbi:hypothetical protein RRG08_008573 [Elysia crispata]|uniref:Uncharacterized protein n=1 Tax=Elysia crispata TaxID=231223 RepID=A0AAE0Y1K9_9GAST|nr:hypothetical protein RRG08_008573 [Elysia crispata]